MNSKRFGLIAAIMIVGAIAAAATMAPWAVAHAYSSDSSSIPLPLPSTGSSSFSFNNSFENLLGPFKAFFTNLTGSIGREPILGPNSANNTAPAPIVNFQNIDLTRGPHALDQWFLSLGSMNIVQAVGAGLKGILWILGFALKAIQWVLGLIR